MKWAIIEGDKVKNVIVATQEFIDNNFPNAVNVDDVMCGVHWSYIEGKFIAPPPPPEIIEEDAETL